MNLSQFYINGKWVDPVKPETLDVINPATEESVGRISVGSIQDVDNAVIAARQAFNSFSKTSVNERIELLTEIRNIYKKRFTEIAEAIMTEMGAPINLASGAQASVGMAHLKTAIRVLGEQKFEYTHNNMVIRKEPIGVCGLITPWNWPINQVLSKLAPCIAAGCTAVLKPSEIAPLSAIIISEIFKRKGESYFRNLEEKITLKALKGVNKIISLGGGGFINDKIRGEVLINHFSFWLNWDESILLKRIKGSKKRPLAFQSTDQEIKQLIKKRTKIYSKAQFKINCNKLTKTEIVKKIIQIYELN